MWEKQGASTFNPASRLKNVEQQLGATAPGRQYDAFGNILAQDPGWTGSPSGYGGAFGYQEDGDSGLKLLGHRYYDPDLGRFLSRDPIKDGRNWYVYCDNNPLTWVDPSGLVPANALATPQRPVPFPPGLDPGLGQGGGLGSPTRPGRNHLDDAWQGSKDWLTGPGGSAIGLAAPALSPAMAVIGGAGAVETINTVGYGGYDYFWDERQDKTSPTWISLRPDDARSSPGLGRPDWEDGSDNPLYSWDAYD